MDELISIVVSTYNWPEALDLSLKSLSAQTDSNFEIIVADDGSGCETARVVEEWCRKSPVKVIHSWQGECQDFCVWGGYSRGSPTRLPFVFEMQYARPDAIAGAKVEGPARSAGGSSLAPAIARREAAGALAREV